jgi:FkbM family methyltransferase
VDRKYYSLNALDQKLEPYVDFDNGYYIELGANDGLTQSNTAYFEKSRGWKGVLIEPSPHRFLDCIRNRSPENAIHCAACVSDDYPDRFVEICYANLMSVAMGLESDLNSTERHLEVASTHMRNQEVLFNFGALARTLTAILDESDAPQDIDFLSLDVEGAEIEVLKGTDFDKYRIRYLLIECRDLGKMKAYLAARGYDYVENLSKTDALFRRRDAAGAETPGAG